MSYNSTDSNIEQKMIDIVAATLKVDKDTISLDAKFMEDLGADSLDLVELMMAIEAAFGCGITDDQASKIATVKDAIKHVRETLALQAGNN